ncbi:MAG: dTDP-4-dehydrorhamnose reductase [Desulfarculales bacterium]|nr:dTDP-4-dehydrorhamnose reductase [Desulfarculales bacterium]
MKIVILGKNGQVGTELLKSLACLGRVLAPGRTEFDLGDAGALQAYFLAHRPAIIVNAAAYTEVDQAQSRPRAAMLLNAALPSRLARLARQTGAWLIHFSSDYVYDGAKTSPYKEDDPPNPLNIYGYSKLAGDRAIMRSGSRHIILRTSWVYSGRRRNFVRSILGLARKRSSVQVVSDQKGAPTSAALLAQVTSQIIPALVRSPHPDNLSGLYHLSARGHISWYGYARYIINQAGRLGGCFPLTAAGIIPCGSGQYPSPAPRPANSCLDSGKLENTFNLSLPAWNYHLDILLQELAEQDWAG